MSGSRTLTEPMGNDDNSPTGRQERSVPIEDPTSADTSSLATGNSVTKNITDWNAGTLFFRHKRLLYTHGFQFKTFKWEMPCESDNTTQYFITTPYAKVPCHAVPWYLTPVEFQTLPYTSQGVYFKTTIKPLGFRTPFTTNSSSIAQANAQLMVIGTYGFGINNKYGGQNLIISSTSSDPMLPTNIAFDSSEGIDTTKLWGRLCKGENDVLTFNDIPASMGNMYKLDNYYCHYYQGFKDMDTSDLSFDEMNTFILSNTNTNPVITWDYKPQVCFLSTATSKDTFRVNHTNTNKEVFSTKINYGYKVPYPYDVSHTTVKGDGDQVIRPAGFRYSVQSNIDILLFCLAGKIV